MPKLSHLTRSSLLIAFLFTLDKALAFVKSLLFNKIVGLEGMGIFGASNNIPDYLSALLSGGALGMAFIPVLREYLDRQGRPAAWDLFVRILNLAFLVTAGASVIIILLAEPLVRYVVAPKFTPENQALTASLMRLDLTAILIFSISGLVMASLQANKHFLLPALAPIFYNLGQIFGVTVLTPEQGLTVGPFTLPAFGLGLYGMVYGVILGAFLHLLIQVPGLIHYQFRWRPVIGLRTPGVVRVLTLLWPRLLTMVSIQAYFVARDNLASHFGEAGVGALNLGWTIQQVPQTVIGTAIAIALLPTLSEFINAGRKDAFRETVNRALRVMLALGLSASALLAVAVRPLAGAFFDFDAAQLDLVTWCTWAFLFGLVGDSWLEVAVRSFYANQNTRTPLAAAAIQAVSFVGLAWLLSRLLGLPGIPLAAALTFTGQALVLHALLNRKFPGLLDIRGTWLRALLAALAGGGMVWLMIRFLPLAPLFSALIGLMAGLAVTLPLIWKEIRLLLNL
ncbi:MAG: murein biosynthesis integral membrane protein MurJ [Anaerolineales bacterium]|nr:murein biosynthesis integral membrane protein MurJ [Anaerolineales bacterium]MDW8227561.1 murein biosynthesis integral membrane protein MurJ [Anaerolineales bacterium]